MKFKFNLVGASIAVATAAFIGGQLFGVVTAHAVDPTVSPDPSASPTVSSTPTVSATPTSSPTPTPSASPTPSCVNFTMPVPSVTNLSTNLGKFSLSWSPISGLPAGCTIREYKVKTYPSGVITSLPSSQTTFTGTAVRYGYFELWAVNSEGGSSVGITTDKFDTFTILPVSDRTQTSAKISWEHISSSASGSKYTIKTKAGSQNWRIENPEVPVVGQSFYNLNSLSPGIYYQVQVIEVNSGLSTTTSFYTLEVTVPTTLGAPGAPRLARANPTTKAISISWMAPSVLSTRKAVANYQIQFREVTDSGWLGTQVSTDTKYVISGLEPGTRYLISLRAVSSDGTQSAAITLYSTTSANLNKPSSLQVAETGDTHADLRWSYVSRADFMPVRHFRVELSKDAGFTWMTILDNLPPTTRLVNIDDLAPETEYAFKVVVVSSSGDEGDAEVKLITRQNLEAITSARVSVNGATAATLKWASLKPEVLENSKALRVQLSTDGKKWKTLKSNLDASATAFKVSKLKAHTKYWMRVATVGKDGYTENSKSFRFTTK